MIAKATPVVDAKEAIDRIKNQRQHHGMTVEGALDLTKIPNLKSLPKGLTCYELDASETDLETIPDDLRVECKLTLRNCQKLKSLPPKFKTGTLDVRGCPMLEALPEGLSVWFLDASDCVALAALPKRAKIEIGGLSVRNCASISRIPAYVKRIATLDVSDCPLITTLPKNLQVGLWVDIGGSGLTELPASLSNTGLRWRSVAIDDRIAFRPEELTSGEILKEKNTELRRVMIERMGHDKFMREAGAKQIDKDTDPGGQRRLLRLPLKGDEDIVCLACSCPSTGRDYLLRVPPDMKTCHQAAAWMAGYDDPKKYKPVMET